MKTRIVYPQMWLDEKFASCAMATKLLFCYLINNLGLGLSPYLHITDRQMMFDTGLTSVQLKIAKEELENLKWVFFTDNWVFHNHKCAYVDYYRNEQVQKAKEKEIEQVPNDVQMLFKQRLNINHKPEIRNNKPDKGVVKGEKTEKSIESLTDADIDQIADDYNVPRPFVLSKVDDIRNYCASKNKRYHDYKATLRNWVKRDAEKIAFDQRKGVKSVDATKVLHPQAEQGRNNLNPGGISTRQGSGSTGIKPGVVYGQNDLNPPHLVDKGSG